MTKVYIRNINTKPLQSVVLLNLKEENIFFTSDYTEIKLSNAEIDRLISELENIKTKPIII